MNTDKPVDMDMLESIFRMQTELNDYVFKKNGLRDIAGEQLTMTTIQSQVQAAALRVNDLPNVWLSHYTRAMRAELQELDDELLWKWWSQDEIDLQNIRVELVDILHFLVSGMISAGLNPQQIYDLYRQKHAVNLNRQARGYSKATKTEDDNRQIDVTG